MLIIFLTWCISCIARLCHGDKDHAWTRLMKLTCHCPHQSVEFPRGNQLLKCQNQRLVFLMLMSWFANSLLGAKMTADKCGQHEAYQVSAIKSSEPFIPKQKSGGLLTLSGYRIWSSDFFRFFFLLYPNFKCIQFTWILIHNGLVKTYLKPLEIR